MRNGFFAFRCWFHLSWSLLCKKPVIILTATDDKYKGRLDHLFGDSRIYSAMVCALVAYYLRKDGTDENELRVEWMKDKLADIIND